MSPVMAESGDPGISRGPLNDHVVTSDFMESLFSLRWLARFLTMIHANHSFDDPASAREMRNAVRDLLLKDNADRISRLPSTLPGWQSGDRLQRMMGEMLEDVRFRALINETKRWRDRVKSLDGNGLYLLSQEFVAMAATVRAGGESDKNTRRLAESLRRKAKIQGSPDAELSALMDDLKTDDPTEIWRAIRDLTLLAHDGHLPAQLELFRRVRDGHQVVGDPALAYYWGHRALTNGAYIEDELAKLGRLLTPEEERSAEWFVHKHRAYGPHISGYEPNAPDFSRSYSPE